MPQQLLKRPRPRLTTIATGLAAILIAGIAVRNAASAPALPAAVRPSSLQAVRPSSPQAFQPSSLPVATSPDYATFTQSYHLPYSKPIDYAALTSMSVRISINGGPVIAVQVDTGSVGIIIGANNVPDIDPKAPPGQMIYSSSGVELDGVWTPAKVTFVDSKWPDGKPAVAEVPVLAATSSMVHPGAVNGGKSTSTAKAAPKAVGAMTKPHAPRVFMMGIGFGRGKEAHPERNPFINLLEMQAGTMRRGYTIGPDGITLGLAGNSVGSGYLFEKLEERDVSADTKTMRPGLKDWETALGGIAVGTEKIRPMGVLMDTGLTNMMLEYPEVTENKDVPDGTPITVYLLGAQLHYSFTVGDKGPTTPRRVTYTHRDALPMLNSGLKSLAPYDYLYDADEGYLGLRLRKVTTTQPAAKPTASTQPTR